MELPQYTKFNKNEQRQNNRIELTKFNEGKELCLKLEDNDKCIIDNVNYIIDDKKCEIANIKNLVNILQNELEAKNREIGRAHV